jgi:hypothetical protein
LRCPVPATARSGATDSSVCCGAGYAIGGWSRIGRTAGRRTGANTATAAPNLADRTGPNVYVREDRMIATVRKLLHQEALLGAGGQSEEDIARHVRRLGLVASRIEASGRLEPEFPA